MENQYYHEHPIQIRFNDVDLLGHVTNSTYPQYFDLGRMSYFETVLGERMDWAEEGLILVSIQIDFKAQVVLHDKIIVRTQIVRLGNKSLTMEQEIFNQTTGLVSATSKGTMAAYSGRLGQSIVLPARWRERIILFERDTNIQE